MSDLEDEDIREYLNDWLDSMMAVYGDVLEEWIQGDYVKPFPDASVTFQCNDCGKCCEFEDHDVWVYPSDMVQWLKDIESNKYIPLFLSALLPVADLDNVLGLGLPSQKDTVDQYNEIIKSTSDKTIIQTLEAILRELKKLNPNFSSKSNKCIYYNSNPTEKQGHCLIYEHRPVQCRSYPFDFPQFTKFEIPNVEEKEDLDDLPMCPPETFKGGKPQYGVLTNEDQRNDVVTEKANYRTSTAIHDWAQESEEWKEIVENDIGDVILEIFHKDLLYMNRETKIIQKTGSPSGDQNNPQKLVAGKRPQKGGSSNKNNRKQELQRRNSINIKKTTKNKEHNPRRTKR